MGNKQILAGGGDSPHPPSRDNPGRWGGEQILGWCGGLPPSLQYLKPCLWKRHCKSVSQLIKDTFSQKQLTEFLWNFIQIFGFLRIKMWYCQEKNNVGKKLEISLKVRAFWNWQKICSIDVLFWGLCDAPSLSSWFFKKFLEKSLSHIIYENVLGQSNCKTF